MGHEQSKDELLFQHVSNNNVEGIKSLRRVGAGLEWVDKKGRTPLILACTKAEFYDVAKTLVELGSNVNASRSGFNGGTPLHHAAYKGLETTVKLLMSNGANPLVLNDGFQTPLEVARDKGCSSVVRAIENHICLFSGWMREFYGPSFLESFAPQLLSRRVWVVIVPTASRNPTKPFKLELVVYATLQDAQPKMMMPLRKSNLEEPKSYQSDASVMIVGQKRRRRRRRRPFVSQERRWVQVDTQTRLKLAAATEGDMQQLDWFCEACKGIPQPRNPSMFLHASQTTTYAINHHAFMSNVESISQERKPSAPPLRARAPMENSPIHYQPVDLTHANMSLPSGTCMICEDASVEAVCVPCGHVAGCISCLKVIKDNKLGCPICRANIDQIIKLYHV